mmetsp:Transcript_13501/g.16083  ORF Transcript_13501/g.16083 Transcript_13501/m.16083 type:complete len:360 (-) Transcript_13501:7-1086(-)
MARRSSTGSSFTWTTNPASNPYATKINSPQPLSRGSVSFSSGEIFQPTRSRKTRSRTVSTVAFYDFTSPETLELRIVLGPLPGMHGLQVLTFVDGERTLRAQGATVGTRIDSVNGHKLEKLHWTKAIELFRDCLSGVVEPIPKEVVTNKKKENEHKDDADDTAGAAAVDDDDVQPDPKHHSLSKGVDFYFNIDFTLPEISTATSLAPVWAAGVKFGPCLSGLGVQVESVRSDCSLASDGVVPGARLLRVGDIELASRGTGGGISYRTGMEALISIGLVSESYGGLIGAQKAEAASSNNSGTQQRQRTGSSITQLGSSVRQSVGNRLRGGSSTSLKSTKMVTVVFALPFSSKEKGKGSNL